MNYLNIMLAVAMIGVSVILAFLTAGVTLPFSLPFIMYGLKMLGVPMQ